MIAAIYARKSTEQNGVADEAKSVTRQIAHVRTSVPGKRWTLCHAFVFLTGIGVISAHTAQETPGPITTGSYQSFHMAEQTGGGDGLSASQPPADTWNAVQGLPAGTRLKLVFADGSEVTGTVVETRADAVVMNDNQPGRTGLTINRGASLRDNVTFTRADVTMASVLKVATRYEAKGARDVVAVRHVITALGIGKKIDLKTTRSEWSRRATIQSIDENGFTVVQGFRAPAMQIAYTEVNQVRPAGMNGFVKGVILISGGMLVLLWWAAAALTAAS